VQLTSTNSSIGLIYALKKILKYRMLDKKNKKLLKIIISDPKTKEKIYQPTYFWKSASNELVKSFIKKGINNFKKNNLANSFFIPLYSFSKRVKTLAIKSFLKKNILGVAKATKSNNYINYLKNKYKLINKNTIPFDYKTFDNFNSEILLFIKN
jgi:hypothetical protein